LGISIFLFFADVPVGCHNRPSGHTRKEIGAPLFYTPSAGIGQIGQRPRRVRMNAARIETSGKKVQVAAGGCGYDF
jgi:hypothetical protein